MSNLITLPLEDGFKTSLSQTWTGGTGTINVVSTPNFTFPAGVTTYIVVNPGNTNMQIAEINAYSAGAKTLTVSNITLEKGASINSTAQTHNVGSEVIISDNYQFWADIQTAINSKIDTLDGQHAVYADDTARDAAIPSPSNGMLVYNTTDGAFNQYISGAWTTTATGSVVNASTTVAGKVEIATDAEVTAGTGTGGTGAVLSVTPTQANTLVNLATTDTTSDETDYYMFGDAAAGDVNKKILKSDLRNDLAASETAKGTVEKATDAEVAAGTDDTRYVTPKGVADNFGSLTEILDVGTLTFDDVAQTNITINHNLGVVPKRMDFIFPEATTVRRIGHWADNGGTITSYARFNDGSFSRVTTTNETIANFDDSNNSNGEWRVDSVSTTQVVLAYTIVFDGGSWPQTTETGVQVIMSN